jgi:uncharacterized phage infection (PIP) family protein YhgE
MKQIVMMSMLVIALGLGACKKAQDLAKYKDQVTAMATTYGPQLADLSKRIPELLGHAKSLEGKVPGLDKVTKLLSENQDKLVQLQGMLGNLPAQLGEDPKAALDNAEKELSTNVAAINDNVKTAEAQINAAEATAAAGSADAGSATP